MYLTFGGGASKKPQFHGTCIFLEVVCNYVYDTVNSPTDWP